MSFEEVLLQAIDEELSSLGETCKQAIYFHLSKKFKLNKRDIPVRIEDFTETIEDIFGAGAKLIEIKIMKNLFSKMGYSFPYLHTQEGLEFTKYIKAARIKGVRPFTLVTCVQL